MLRRETGETHSPGGWFPSGLTSVVCSVPRSVGGDHHLHRLPGPVLPGLHCAAELGEGLSAGNMLTARPALGKSPLSPPRFSPLSLLPSPPHSLYSLVVVVLTASNSDSKGQMTLALLTPLCLFT